MDMHTAPINHSRQPCLHCSQCFI